MDIKIRKFDDTKIEKYKFYQHKNPFLINNIDLNKIVVSNKVPLGKQGFEYLTWCQDSKKIELYAYSLKQ